MSNVNVNTDLPLITEVLNTIDWLHHINVEKKRPFIDCRDEFGNMYTVSPFFDRVYATRAPEPRKNFCLVHKTPK